MDFNRLLRSVPCNVFSERRTKEKESEKESVCVYLFSTWIRCSLFCFYIIDDLVCVSCAPFHFIAKIVFIF